MVTFFESTMFISTLLFFKNFKNALHSSTVNETAVISHLYESLKQSATAALGRHVPQIEKVDPQTR